MPLFLTATPMIGGIPLGAAYVLMGPGGLLLIVTLAFRVWLVFFVTLLGIALLWALLAQRTRTNPRWLSDQFKRATQRRVYRQHRNLRTYD